MQAARVSPRRVSTDPLLATVRKIDCPLVLERKLTLRRFLGGVEWDAAVLNAMQHGVNITDASARSVAEYRSSSSSRHLAPFGINDAEQDGE